MEPYYQDELVTLYHADCLALPVWLEADVLVTDPPYGMALRSNRSGVLGDLGIANDESVATRDRAVEAWGNRPSVIFGRWSVPPPKPPKAMPIWDKGEHTGMGDIHFPWKPNYEVIFINGSGYLGHRGSSILRKNAPPPSGGQGREHPTEKPVSLMESLIAKCPPGKVADPFAGSGSTLIAAKNLGRKAIGVELDERYCKIAAARLTQDALPFGDIA